METVEQRLSAVWMRARANVERLRTLACTRALTVPEVVALVDSAKLQGKIIRMESDLGEAQQIISQITSGIGMVEKDLDEIEHSLKVDE